MIDSEVVIKMKNWNRL